MYLQTRCQRCVLDGKCDSQRDPQTSYCVSVNEHKAMVFSNMCENCNVSESDIKTAMTGSYLTMTDDEICNFIKKYSEEHNQ